MLIILTVSGAQEIDTRDDLTILVMQFGCTVSDTSSRKRLLTGSLQTEALDLTTQIEKRQSYARSSVKLIRKVSNRFRIVLSRSL